MSDDPSEDTEWPGVEVRAWVHGHAYQPVDTDNDDGPRTVPRDGVPSAFIQWKGTNVCLDFSCPCGRNSHVDGWFAYSLRCSCGRVFVMPHTVQLVEDTTWREPMGNGRTVL